MFLFVQTLRAGASYLVATGHIPGSWIHGAIGVDIFFVISGFVIAHISLDKSMAKASALEFLSRRLLRVLPLYWLVSLLIFCYFLYSPESSYYALTPEHILKSFLLIPESQNGVFKAPIIPAGWTLSFELYFYLIVTILIAMGMASSWTVSIALILPATFGSLVAPSNPVFALLTAPILIEFAIGLWVYKLRNSHRVIRTLALVFGLALCFATASGTAVAQGLSYGSGQISLGYDLFLPRWLAWGIPAGLLVLGMSTLEPFVRQISIRGTILRLGDESYSLYLIHQAALGATILSLQSLSIPTSPVLSFFICLTVLTGASFLCYRWIERPMLKLVGYEK